MVWIVIFVALVVFAINRIITADERKHAKELKRLRKKSLKNDKKAFPLAKEKFINSFPHNILECAKALAEIKDIVLRFPSEFPEAEDFIKEAEAMIRDAERIGYIGPSAMEAALGDTDKMFIQGCFNITDNIAEALEWFLLGAERGNAKCQHYCANIYHGKRGHSIPQDNEKALYWYRKAAESNRSDYMIDLANIYYNGEICSRDYLSAAKWFAKAGDKGDGMSSYNAYVSYNNYAYEYAKRNHIKPGEYIDASSPYFTYVKLCKKYEEQYKKQGYVPEE